MVKTFWFPNKHTFFTFSGRYAGAYGWDNAAYIAIAGRKAGLDLENHHGKRSPVSLHFLPPKTTQTSYLEDEHYIPEFKGKKETFVESLLCMFYFLLRVA